MTNADVERHFGLVGYVLGRMTANGQLVLDLEREDLEAVGRFAVFQALRRWDPSKGRQSSFLYPYVWGTVMRYQRDVSKPLGYSRKDGQVATVVSLDAPLGEDGRTWLDLLADEEAPPEDRADRQLAQLMRAAARLEGSERVIAEHLLAGETASSAAGQLGVSRTTACKIAKRVRRVLADELAAVA